MYTKRVNAAVTAEQKESLKRASKRTGMSMSALLRLALERMEAEEDYAHEKGLRVNDRKKRK